MIDETFDAFDTIDKALGSGIAEISVKRSQFVFTFVEDGIIDMLDLLKLNSLDNDLAVSDVTCFQERLYVAIRDVDPSKMSEDSIFYPFSRLITTLRDLICSCPALEYIISREYIKVFVDLPNIKVSDLNKTIEVLKQDAFVELGGDRPYLLFINEAMYVTEEIQ